MNEIEEELAKVAGTLVTEVAEDLVRPTSKSIGENVGLLVDGVMGWLGYWGKKQQIKQVECLEQYKEQITRKIAKIPEESLVEPSIRIIGPAIESSKFFVEEENCREMFAELIASSCNSAVSGSVHPSFPEIIKQLSPLDARFLQLFKKQSTFPVAELTNRQANGLLTPFPNLLFDFMAVPNNFSYNEHLELSKTVDMLIRFGLLNKNKRIIQLNYDYNSFKNHWFYKYVKENVEEDSTLIIHTYRLELTLLGKDFVRSCVSDDTEK